MNTVIFKPCKIGILRSFIHHASKFYRNLVTIALKRSICRVIIHVSNNNAAKRNNVAYSFLEILAFFQHGSQIFYRWK